MTDISSDRFINIRKSMRKNEQPLFVAAHFVYNRKAKVKNE